MKLFKTLLSLLLLILCFFACGCERVVIIDRNGSENGDISLVSGDDSSTDTENASDIEVSATDESSEHEFSGDDSEDISQIEPSADTSENGHSVFYDEDLSVDDLITYFNEVCLDAEYSYNSNNTVVRKWRQPIYYKIYGEADETDIAIIEKTAELLNCIDGFYGMYEAKSEETVNLPIYFCNGDEFLEIMGSPFTENENGGVTVWFNGLSQITNGKIGIRCDSVTREERHSIIVEEIYNGLGALQDTVLRTDSVINQYSDSAVQMSKTDIIILQMLYNEEILCGMDALECEKVIRRIYY